MTKEQFERAKEIEEELIHIRATIDIFDKNNEKVYFEGCKVDLSGVLSNYKRDTITLLTDRQKVLETEFGNL